MTSSIPKIANNVGQSAEELLRLYRIEASHMEAIRSMREEARPRIDGVIEKFYQWMGGHPEMMAFFETEESMLHVRKMQTIYWERFLDANVNNEYLRDRRRIGEIHARIGLPVMFYIGAINMVYDELKLVAREVVQDASSENRVAQFESTCQSLAGLIHLDAGLICQSAQVDGHLPAAVTASDQTRHHSRVEGCAASVHKGDQPRWSPFWLHGPAAQQQGMAVPAAGQDESSTSWVLRS